jgi:hypothetical protein
MNRVFVINKSCHDFSKAQAWGQLVYLTEGNLNRYNTSSMFRQFEEAIKSSSSTDYLLLSGMTIMSTLAAAMFAAKHHRLNLLIWKSDKQDYIERITMLEGL